MDQLCRRLPDGFRGLQALDGKENPMSPETRNPTTRAGLGMPHYRAEVMTLSFEDWLNVAKDKMPMGGF
jgi:hypothetical protein